MKTLTQILYAIAAFALAGCATQPFINITTVQETENPRAARILFTRDETMAVRVGDVKGILKMMVRRVSDGKVIFQSSEKPIEHGHRIWSIGKLPAGRYRAEISIDGKLVGGKEFGVS